MNRVARLVQEAGVTGAGGAGFPAHVKLQAKVDTVIANGAECEPLLSCDKEVMKNYPHLVVEGLEKAMEATGAKRGVIAVKEHYPDAVKAIQGTIKGARHIELFPLGNFYPAGDEHILVNLVTGRVIGEGGIPLHLSCLVHNVTTLMNIAMALRGTPVTYRYLTVAGEVKRPRTFKVPLGTPYRKVLELAGGPVIEGWRAVDGGPMMGQMVKDLDAGISKTTSGLLILPEDLNLVSNLCRGIKREILLSQTVCCQCRMCTDLCPRYLLGHSLQPHLMMRSIVNLLDSPTRYITQAYLCSLCGVCEVYACPLHLSPRKIFAAIRERLAAEGVKNPHTRRIEGPRAEIHERRVPFARISPRAGVERYMRDLPFDDNYYPVETVRIPLKNNFGVPAEPLVKKGESVMEGELIGSIPEGKMGVRVHASIQGKVSSVTGDYIEISR